MIHRSGSSARNLLPTSAATSRTWATSVLSSVSGMVKNCGAWGSMAPPITVDIMVVLLVRSLSPICHVKNIPLSMARQADGAPGFCLNAPPARAQDQQHIARTGMVDVPITIACGNYDRTQAIKDGVVKVEGCAVTYLPLYPEEIFFRAFRYQEFDVSEISFSSYIRTVANGTSAYIGIPAFGSRIFRSPANYVGRD